MLIIIDYVPNQVKLIVDKSSCLEQLLIKYYSTFAFDVKGPQCSGKGFTIHWHLKVKGSQMHRPLHLMIKDTVNPIMLEVPLYWRD